MEKKNSISDILIKIPRTFEKMDRKDRPKDMPSMEIPNDDQRRIYLDLTVYTVIRDDNGNYNE